MMIKESQKVQKKQFFEKKFLILWGRFNEDLRASDL